MNRSQIRILFTVMFLWECSHGQCVCDYSSTSRKLSRTSDAKKRVTFAPAAVKGDVYERKFEASKPYVPPVKDTVESSCPSEQIHISLGDSLDSVVVSFASFQYVTNSTVQYSTDIDALMNIGEEKHDEKVKMATGGMRAYSELLYTVYFASNPAMGQPTIDTQEVIDMLDTSDWAFDPKTGDHFANWYNVTEYTSGFGQYNNPDFYYNSPVLHTVPLVDLSTETTYFYRVSGSCEIFNFTTVPFYFSSTPSKHIPDMYPFKLGLTGDVGLTEISIMSLGALGALEPNAVLLVGDLSYADGWQYCWDTFGNAAQDLLDAHVPLLATVGNHEVQSGENNVPFNLRYSTPYISSLSPDPAYWGREVGPVHVIALNSYAGYATNSIQYKWLETYLATRINRQRTPWVLVMHHTPWYNSNTGHWKEGEKLRANMEHLFYQYGVDLSLSGHVHSYERTTGVYNNSVNECGTTYFNLGDGGNYEGKSGTWQYPAPEWTSFREDSFGVAGLNIVNETHAFFSWHRHACQSNDAAAYHMNFSSSCVTDGDNSEQPMETSDELWIVKPSSDLCPNRYVGSDYEPMDPSSLITNDDDDEEEDKSGYLVHISTLNLILVGACVALLITALMLGRALHIVMRDGISDGMAGAADGGHGAGSSEGGGAASLKSADVKYDQLSDQSEHPTTVDNPISAALDA